MKKIYIILGFTLSLFYCCRVLAQENQTTINQINLLIQEKNQRTPAQQKMASQLLQAVKEKRGEAMAAGVTLAPADVNADASGNLLVDIRGVVSESLLTAIRNVGGSIVFASQEYSSVRANINLNSVEAIAALETVQFIGPAAQAYTVGAGNKPLSGVMSGSDLPIPKIGQNKPSIAIRKKSIKERMERIQQQLQRILGTGTISSQGDRAHRADDVRTTYGAQGQGIKIGVLSDSYNATGGAVSDVYNGNLPGSGNPLGNITPVTVVADYAGQADEGRAMLQIVHDLAPKAQLFFATAFVSEASFASNITALRNTYGCDIIIDDIFYYDEPQFQDGIVAQAVAGVTAAGALYFSSAGNEGNVAKNTAGVWEGDFNDAGSLPFVNPVTATKTGTIHNWGTVATPVNGNIIKAAGNVYAINWSDPAYASSNDYDLFLVSSAGVLKASSTTTQNGTQPAFEGFGSVALVTGDRLIVFKSTGAQVRAICLNTFRGTLTNFTSGQTHGHSAVVAAFSVAAASALQTSGSPFSATSVVESFTSDGLRRIFYNPDGSAITPGNVLFATNGGTVRNKPDITAADGVSTSLPLNGGLNPFYGTSAAAPHAGAIAALIKSAKPSITNAQMRTALTTTTLDIESAGYDNISGFGMVQAFQATQSVSPTLLADISLNSFTASEIAGDNGNGAIDPGEIIKLAVSLKNPSLVTATGVTATLTSNTTGVTVTSSSATYGNIAAAASATNSAAPFAFSVSTSVTCGTQLSFTLTVNFGAGGVSPQTYPITLNLGGQPGASISAVLGTPAASTTFYTSSTGSQTGRLTRAAPFSVCGTSKATPSLTATTGARKYDAYVFSNTSGVSQCVTNTIISANGTLLYVVAYTGTFIPATPSVNFLADQAQSGTGQSFSFNVASGQTFTIVVHEVNVGAATGTAYNLNVSLSTCSSVVLPVTWLGFTAIEQSGQAALQWKVANEINADHYEVEYSTNGNNFTKLYTVKATPPTATDKTYSHLHPFPIVGYNYYRIRQVDLDGRYSYSKIGSVLINKANNLIMAPNPASLFVNIQSKNVIDRIKLFNAIGQLVKDVAPATATYTLAIDNLPAGEYVAQVATGGTTIQQKIIKN